MRDGYLDNQEDLLMGAGSESESVCSYGTQQITGGENEHKGGRDKIFFSVGKRKKCRL